MSAPAPVRRPWSKAHDPRACLHCGAVKPPEAFDYGPTGKRRLGRCRDCIATEAAEREQRIAARRVTWQDPQTGRWVRRCGKCMEVKPLASGFNWANAEHTECQYRCRKCESKRTAARRKALIADPATRTAERAKRTAYAKAWRAKHPERYRAMTRAYRERKKRDAARMNRERQSARLRYRERAQAQGRDPKALKTSRLGPVRGTVEQEQGGHLPAAPLAAAIASRRGQRTIEQWCRDLGVPPRTYSAWRTGERGQVQMDLADRVMLRLGLNWFDVYDAERWPEAHKRAEALFG